MRLFVTLLLHAVDASHMIYYNSYTGTSVTDPFLPATLNSIVPWVGPFPKMQEQTVGMNVTGKVVYLAKRPLACMPEDWGPSISGPTVIMLPGNMWGRDAKASAGNCLDYYSTMMKYLETHPYGDDLVAILLIGQVFYNEFNAQRRWDMVNYDVKFPFMMVNRAVGPVRGGGRIIKQLNTPNTTVIAVLTSGIPPDEVNENWLQDKIFGVGNMIATWIYFILLLGSMAFQLVVMKLQCKAKMPWWHPMSSFLNFFYATCTMLQNGPFGPWSLHVWNYIMVSWLVCIPLGTTWATSMAMAYEWIVVILPRTDYTKYIKILLA